jgi:tape measure domain-containing protein
LSEIQSVINGLDLSKVSTLNTDSLIGNLNNLIDSLPKEIGSVDSDAFRSEIDKVILAITDLIQVLKGLEKGLNVKGFRTASNEIELSINKIVNNLQSIADVNIGEVTKKSTPTIENVNERKELDNSQSNAILREILTEIKSLAKGGLSFPQGMPPVSEVFPPVKKIDPVQAITTAIPRLRGQGSSNGEKPNDGGLLKLIDEFPQLNINIKNERNKYKKVGELRSELTTAINQLGEADEELLKNISDFIVKQWSILALDKHKNYSPSNLGENDIPNLENKDANKLFSLNGQKYKQMGGLIAAATNAGLDKEIIGEKLNTNFGLDLNSVNEMTTQYLRELIQPLKELSLVTLKETASKKQMLTAIKDFVEFSKNSQPKIISTEGENTSAESNKLPLGYQVALKEVFTAYGISDLQNVNIPKIVQGNMNDEEDAFYTPESNTISLPEKDVNLLFQGGITPEIMRKLLHELGHAVVSRFGELKFNSVASTLQPVEIHIELTDEAKEKAKEFAAEYIKPPNSYKNPMIVDEEYTVESVAQTLLSGAMGKFDFLSNNKEAEPTGTVKESLGIENLKILRSILQTLKEINFSLIAWPRDGINKDIRQGNEEGINRIKVKNNSVEQSNLVANSPTEVGNPEEVGSRWAAAQGEVKQVMDDIVEHSATQGYEIQKNFSSGSPGLLTEILGRWDRAVNVFGNIFEQVGLAAQSTGASMRESFLVSLETSQQNANENATDFTNRLNSLGVQMSNNANEGVTQLGNHINLFQNTFEREFSEIGSGLEEFNNRVNYGFGTFSDSFSFFENGQFTQGFDSIGQSVFGLGNAFGTLSDDVNNSVNNVTSSLSNLATQSVSIGESFTNDLVSGGRDLLGIEAPIIEVGNQVEEQTVEEPPAVDSFAGVRGAAQSLFRLAQDFGHIQAAFAEQIAADVAAGIEITGNPLLDGLALMQRIDESSEEFEGRLGERSESALDLYNTMVAIFDVANGITFMQTVVSTLSDATAAGTELFLRLEKVKILLRDLSSDSGEGALKNIKEWSAKNNASFTSTAEGYAGFRSSVLGTGLEASAESTFLKFASGMSAAGLDTEAQARSFTALGQMAAKSTVSMEELSGQLAEALPGSLSIAARAMGMTTSELVDLVSTGKVLAEDLLPKLANQFESESYLTMIESQSSLNVGLAKFNSQIEELQLGLAEGLIPVFGALVAAGNTVFSVLKDYIAIPLAVIAAIGWSMLEKFIPGVATLVRVLFSWKNVMTATGIATFRLTAAQQGLRIAMAGAARTAQALAASLLKMLLIPSLIEGVITLVYGISTAGNASLKNLDKSFDDLNKRLKNNLGELYKTTKNPIEITILTKYKDEKEDKEKEWEKSRIGTYKRNTTDLLGRVFSDPVGTAVGGLPGGLFIDRQKLQAGDTPGRNLRNAFGIGSQVTYTDREGLSNTRRFSSPNMIMGWSRNQENLENILSKSTKFRTDVQRTTLNPIFIANTKKEILQRQAELKGLNAELSSARDNKDYPLQKKKTDEYGKKKKELEDFIAQRTAGGVDLGKVQESLLAALAQLEKEGSEGEFGMGWDRIQEKIKTVKKEIAALQPALKANADIVRTIDESLANMADSTKAINNDFNDSLKKTSISFVKENIALYSDETLTDRQLSEKENRLALNNSKTNLNSIGEKQNSLGGILNTPILDPLVTKQFDLKKGASFKDLAETGVAPESIQSFMDTFASEMQKNPDLTATLQSTINYIETLKSYDEAKLEFLKEDRTFYDSLKEQESTLKGFLRSLEDLDLSISDFFRDRARTIYDTRIQLEDASIQNQRGNRDLVEAHKDLMLSLETQLLSTANEIKKIESELNRRTTINKLRSGLEFGQKGFLADFINLVETVSTSETDVKNESLTIEEQRLAIANDMLGIAKQIRSLQEQVFDLERTREKQQEDLTRQLTDFVTAQKSAWRAIENQTQDMVLEAQRMGFNFTGIADSIQGINSAYVDIHNNISKLSDAVRASAESYQGQMNNGGGGYTAGEGTADSGSISTGGYTFDMKAKLENTTMEQRRAFAMHYLMTEKKQTLEQASGIAGNMQKESSFNPYIVNPDGGAYASMQWTSVGGRKENRKKFAPTTGYVYKDLANDIDFALDKELKTTHKDAAVALKKAKTTQQAVTAWNEEFEISGDSSTGDRLTYGLQSEAVGRQLLAKPPVTTTTNANNKPKSTGNATGDNNSTSKKKTTPVFNSASIINQGSSKYDTPQQIWENLLVPKNNNPGQNIIGMLTPINEALAKGVIDAVALGILKLDFNTKTQKIERAKFDYEKLKGLKEGEQKNNIKKAFPNYTASFIYGKEDLEELTQKLFKVKKINENPKGPYKKLLPPNIINYNNFTEDDLTKLSKNRNNLGKNKKEIELFLKAVDSGRITPFYDEKTKRLKGWDVNNDKPFSESEQFNKLFDSYKDKDGYFKFQEFEKLLKTGLRQNNESSQNEQSNLPSSNLVAANFDPNVVSDMGGYLPTQQKQTLDTEQFNWVKDGININTGPLKELQEKGFDFNEPDKNQIAQVPILNKSNNTQKQNTQNVANNQSNWQPVSAIGATKKEQGELSTGSHLHIEAKQNGQYIDPDKYTDYFKVGNKPIDAYRMTSDYGMRTHPKTGKYKMHNGMDYGIPGGTVLSVDTSKLEPLGYSYSQSAGGITKFKDRENGNIIQLLHQADESQQLINQAIGNLGNGITRLNENITIPKIGKITPITLNNGSVITSSLANATSNQNNSYQAPANRDYMANATGAVISYSDIQPLMDIIEQNKTLSSDETKALLYEILSLKEAGNLKGIQEIMEQLGYSLQDLRQYKVNLEMANIEQKKEAERLESEVKMYDFVQGLLDTTRQVQDSAFSLKSQVADLALNAKGYLTFDEETAKQFTEITNKAREMDRAFFELNKQMDTALGFTQNMTDEERSKREAEYIPQLKASIENNKDMSSAKKQQLLTIVDDALVPNRDKIKLIRKEFELETSKANFALEEQTRTTGINRAYEKRLEIMKGLAQYSRVIAEYENKKNPFDTDGLRKVTAIEEMIRQKEEFKALEDYAKRFPEMAGVVAELTEQLAELNKTKLDDVIKETSLFYKGFNEPIKNVIGDTINSFTKGEKSFNDIAKSFLDSIANFFIEMTATMLQNQAMKLLSNLFEGTFIGEYLGLQNVNNVRQDVTGQSISSVASLAGMGFQSIGTEPYDLSGASLTGETIAYDFSKTTEQLAISLNDGLLNSFTSVGQILDDSADNQYILLTQLLSMLSGGVAAEGGSGGLLGTVIGTGIDMLTGAFTGGGTGLGDFASPDAFTNIGAGATNFSFDTGTKLISSTFPTFKEGGQIKPQDIPNFKDGGRILDKIPNIANFMAGGEIKPAMIPNFKEGGAIGQKIPKVDNFAKGGTVKDKLSSMINLSLGISKAMKKEGANAVPAVLSVNEEVLQYTNGDADYFRVLEKSGVWESLKSDYKYNRSIPNYLNGGSIGNPSTNNMNRSNSNMVVNNNSYVTVKATDVNSFRKSSSLIAQEQKMAQSKANNYI